MRRFVGVAAVAVAAFFVFVLVAAAAPSGVTSNGFETNTDGWFGVAGSTINQRADSYANPGGYANFVSDGVDATPINAADGSYYAGLNRGTCSIQLGGGGNTVNCPGPYTDWGNLNNYTWNGPYTTQVDIYLDTAYANAHPDTYGGNLALATGSNSTDPTYKGTRFDVTSAINSATPDMNGDAVHLRDFGFNVSTGYAGDSCDGFMITAQPVVNRINANPNTGAHDPQCIDQTGWYTFKWAFSSQNDYLDVLMTITPVGGSTPDASWDITKGSPSYYNGDPDGTYGCNRYGWFSDQEIYGLPIDNAKIEGGCTGPTITGGQIAPTGTTCQDYSSGTAGTLDQVLYTLKNEMINSVSPGVFFYYGTITGMQDQTFTITQTNDGTNVPSIPVQHGQVILYDTSCNVVKWSPTSDANGVVTGTLPSTGTFIISVKYNPGALKGTSDPGTVTYTIDGATVTLAPKF